MREEMPPTTEPDQGVTEPPARSLGSLWLLCVVYYASREQLKLLLHRRRTCLTSLLCGRPASSRLQRCARSRRQGRAALVCCEDRALF